MAGEMNWIGQDGVDATGNEWPIHAAIAKAVDGELKPFDQYQGPYIVVGADLVVGEPPYGVLIQNQGCTRLWLCSPEDELGDSHCYIYREDTEESSELFFCEDTATAIAMAKRLLGREESHRD